MNTPPKDERSEAIASSEGSEENSPWVWRTEKMAKAHIEARYPWLAKVIGTHALYRLAFDILLEKRS